MNYWLMKSEPGVFSIEDLARARTTGWDGVRNYQARNFLKAMAPGDLSLFYHSNAAPPAAVGVMRIARSAYPDPTQFDPKNSHFDPHSPPASPRWLQVDVSFVEKFERPVTLEAIKAEKDLREMALLKLGRLSVQPVTPAEWAAVSKMAQGR